MSNVKILLVEDDPSYALELQMLVDELGYETLATVDHAEAVFDILKKEKPDLILMDIQIKGEMSGIEIAKQIESEKINIIFITSFDDKAKYAEANTTKNFGYIVKPFNHLTLESAIEVALMNSIKNEEEITEEDVEEKNESPNWEEDLILKDHVFIKKRNRLEKVAINDILFLEADGNYCIITTETKKFILKMSLKKANEIFSSHDFMRVNKSSILNMNEVSSIVLSDNQMILGNKNFPIGKRYKAKVMKRLRLMT